MMRILAVLPLLLLAGCLDDADANQQAAKAAAEAAANVKLAAGQWETTAEVTKLTSMDKASPAIDTPPGTKTSGSECVSAADIEKPAPALFVGDKGECKYDNFYMSGGSLSATLTCKRPGLDGSVMMNVNGSYTATTFDADLDISTYLVTDGDVNISSKVSGRRVGVCKSA